MANITKLKQHIKDLMKGALAEDRDELREQMKLIKGRIKRAEREANVNEMTASGGAAAFTTSGPAVGQMPNRYMSSMDSLVERETGDGSGAAVPQPTRRRRRRKKEDE